MADKLHKKCAQIVFDEISKPRGPGDKIQSVISLCVESGAETHKAEAPPPPKPIILDPVVDEDVAEPSDNAFGEGAVATE